MYSCRRRLVRVAAIAANNKPPLALPQALLGGRGATRLQYRQKHDRVTDYQRASYYRLFPPVTFWETAWAAGSGIKSVLMDQSAREWYVSAVQQKIIKDTVLHQATNGSLLTYALFHNLKLMSEQYQFDAQEFVTAVGPALENFYEMLGLLRNSMMDENVQNASTENINTINDDNNNNNNNSTTTPPSELDPSETSPDKNDVLTDSEKQIISDLGIHANSSNKWRQDATADPNSLAAKLARITTEQCFNELYYINKFHIDFYAEVMQQASKRQAFHVPGTTTIDEFALLRARVMDFGIMPPHTGDEVHNFDATHSSSFSSSAASGVAAQMDVLVQLQHEIEFREIPARTDTAAAAATTTTTNASEAAVGEQAGNEQIVGEATVGEAAVGERDGTLSSSNLDKDSKKDDVESALPESSTLHRLLVVELEGYIQGGPDQVDATGQKQPHSLKWKVANTRVAHEFPFAVPELLGNMSETHKK